MTARAVGLAAGWLADTALADPARAHPVAGFGRLAARLEQFSYADRRRAGMLHVAVAVGVPAAVTGWLQTRLPLPARTVLLTALCWTALGGTSLAREGELMHQALAAADLPAARDRLTHLCARDPRELDSDQLVRATVESLAENTSDAAVAPLFWAVVAGAPGVVAYRAINTLDAMIGYRSARYARFGWAAARLDDLVNLAPSRLTALLTVPCAAAVGGSAVGAWRIWRRDGGRHPSPNAGQVEAAFAGALGIRLGGSNVYHGEAETRATLGDGSTPQLDDLNRAIDLSRAVSAAAALVAVLAAVAIERRSR